MATATAVPEAAVQLEVVAARKTLLNALSAVIGVIERKTTIPILANILLEASPDGTLTLSGTNLDQSITMRTSAQVRGEGSLTIPALKFYDYMKVLAGDEVRLLQQENNWVQIRCGRSKTKMVGMGRQQYPALPTPAKDAPISVFQAGVLRTMIEKVMPSVSQEESRYALNGALLKFTNGRVEMISTDGHRLAHISKSGAFEGETGHFLIPGPALRELYKLIAVVGAESVCVENDEKTLFFKIGLDTVFSSRRMSGQFPNYDAVIPEADGVGVILDVATMNAALARCLVFSPSESRFVALTTTENELRIRSAAPDIGETEESIDILHGKPLTVGFNGEYLKDLFGMVSENVEMHLTNEQNAALFIWRNDEGYTLKYVSMPMRPKSGGK